jgi:hypothetical protein
MADLVTDYIAYLKTQTAVTDLVGTRIFPDTTTQDTLRPLVLVSLVSDVPTDHVGGTNFAQARVQVDVIADKKITAAPVREALRSVTNYFRGTMGTQTIRGCTTETQRDDYAPPRTGEKLGWFMASIDFLFSHLVS